MHSVRTLQTEAQPTEVQPLPLAQSVILIIPNPMRYNDMLRMVTSIPTLNSADISVKAGEITDVPKLETRMASETESVTYLLLALNEKYVYHFFHFGQLRGFWGSASPSQDTSRGASDPF